jgi:hypothetical protein
MNKNNINWDDWDNEEEIYDNNNLLEIFNNQYIEPFDKKTPFTFELRKEDFGNFTLYCKKHKICKLFTHSVFYNNNKIYVYLYFKKDFQFVEYMPYNEHGDKYNINNHRKSYGEIRFSEI